MALSSKSLRQAFRCCGPISGLAGRPFWRSFTSSTIYRMSSVPKFAPTSSPELDAILSKLRFNLFMPALLSPAQKKLIYNLDNKEKLETETYIATIDGEEFRLTQLDKTKDIPNCSRALMNAIHLMKDRKDWQNLPRLLKGMKAIGQKLKHPRPQQILREAARAGRMDVMVECARQVSGTGFVLNDPELVQLYMFHIQDKGRQSDWDPLVTSKALRLAEEVAKVLEETTHVEAAKSVKLQPRKDPLVIGVLLELAAICATQIEPESEEDKANMVIKVSTFAERFLASELKTIQPPLGVSEGGTSRDMTPIALAYARAHYLRSLVPTARGIKIAQTIIDPNTTVAEGLKAQQSEFEKIMDSLHSQILGVGIPPSTGGLLSYQEYMAGKMS